MRLRDPRPVLAATLLMLAGCRTGGSTAGSVEDGATEAGPPGGTDARGADALRPAERDAGPADLGRPHAHDARGAGADATVGPADARTPALDIPIAADAAPLDAHRPTDGPRPRDDARPELGATDAAPVNDARVSEAGSDGPADARADARTNADADADAALADLGPPLLPLDLGPPPAPPFDAFAGDLLASPRPPDQGPPRVVILMIGDGMGPGHLDAARAWLGHPLNLESRLPFHGRVVTSSLDGVTDSAAAATTMGSGVPTDNHFLGLDGEGVRVTVGVELAHALGARAGLVTTASLPHATPAGFAAHVRSRYDYQHIAESMVRTQPEVLLGGGRLFLWPRGPLSQRHDSGLVQPLLDVGYALATTREELARAQPDERGRLLGVFAAEHLAYVFDRPADTAEPTLSEMTAKALEVLSPAPGGFFLMVEGAKIDLASHANQNARMVPEVVAFDEAVGVVLDWAAERENTTVLVTADHETGELSVTEDRGPGVLPAVRWRRSGHSNRLVDLFGAGPAAAVFHGRVLPNRWIHAVLRAGLSGEPVSPPASALIPDGRFDDLLPVGEQLRETDFGAGLNQLDALSVGVDAYGLNLGVTGLFERGRNAVTLLLDADFGAATGPTVLAGTLTDAIGRADIVLSHLRWDAAGIEGLGFDRAVVVFGGQDVTRESRHTDAGLRGFTPPDVLPWYGVPITFGEAVRPDGAPLPPVADEGLETNLRWRDLFGAGGFPRGARVAVFVTLTNDDATVTSTQCLPPLPPGAAPPLGNPAPVPGVYVLNLDTDLDAVPDPVPTVEFVPARPGVVP